MSIRALQRGFNFLIISIFILICLGALVRALNAGLACPDWPLCFGQLIPDWHPQVFLEFIHRALAGLEALVSFYLAYHIFRNHQVDKSIQNLMLVALLLLLVQVVVGGLTVLKLLSANIVILHLFLATLFLLCLLWIRFYLSAPTKLAFSMPISARMFSIFLFVVIYGQLILGGNVAANYAGKVCSDFPTCNGVWFPPLEGMIGIQMIHRIGGYLTLFSSLFLLIWWWQKKSKNWFHMEVLRNHIIIFVLVIVQFSLGIINIKFGLPPIITVSHSAVAVLMLSFALRNVFLLR